MKFNLEVIQKYIDDGLLVCQIHPTLPLKIYNYSRTCQYERKWDEITLNFRGMILDDKGNMVARSLPKFFNLSEDVIIPDDKYCYVQNKEDGSMLILFNYEGEWITATRGSFTSDQCVKGMEILKSKYDLNNFHKNITYIGEVIYPQNIVVVNNGDIERVVFITAYSGNNELNWTTAKAIFYSSGMLEEDIVNTQYYDMTIDMAKLQKLDEENKEGFVVRFVPSNKRIKIKYDNYVRLHRLITNFSNVDIWECLKNGIDFNILLENVPDEYDDFVRKVRSDLLSEYSKIEINSHSLFEEFKNKRPGFPFGDVGKKEFAMWVKEQPKENQPILFKIYDENYYSDIIWKLIKPTYVKPKWGGGKN
jgi:RNA ligase